MNIDNKKVSKMMSLILRHNPGFIKVKLDNNGWLNIDELINGLSLKGYKITRDLLDEIVVSNNKQRFAISEDGKNIRANQGHSVAVDVELKEAQPPLYLYHGTVDKFMSSIRSNGLKKMNRNHVHLSKDRETAEIVGSRRGKAIILSIRSDEMSNDGFKFYLSENGVWLTDHVPVQYLG